MCGVPQSTGVFSVPDYNCPQIAIHNNRGCQSVSGSACRHLSFAVVVLAMLFSTMAGADVAAAPDAVADSYRMLQRLGLLKTPPAAPVQVQVKQETAVVANHQAAPAASEMVVSAMPHDTGNGQQPSSRAYDVLRRLGLLPSDAPAPRAVVRATNVRVVVEKSKRRLYVLRNGKPLLEYPVMLGGVPVGPKLQAGDLRTPEGVYTLDWRNPKSRFYKSMHISYPGPLDRQRAEERGVDPGGMIMLHGEHDEPALRRILRRRARDWTEGCIALNNEDMDEIWRTVPDGTPIEIRP